VITAKNSVNLWFIFLVTVTVQDETDASEQVLALVGK
jgi:hypothetical protein